MKIRLSPILLIFLATNPSSAASSFYSFATTSSPVTLTGSDDGTGNPITFTSSPITTGTGTAGADHGNQTISGAGPDYTGSVITSPSLSSPLTTDPNLMALIHAQPYADVGNGDAGETYHNAIGIHVHFTAPIPLATFAMIDFDGGREERREWGTSWAYNDVTMNSIAPNITLHSTTSLATNTGVNANALYPTLNAPTSLEFVELTVDANAAPDDLEFQAAFDYNNQSVTDLYFLYGAQGNATNNAQRSGVTGLALTVPEPSSAALLSFAFLTLLTRRRKG